MLAARRVGRVRWPPSRRGTSTREGPRRRWRRPPTERPRAVLDEGHTAWTAYRHCDGQPLDQFLVKEQGVEVDKSGPLDFLPCVNTESQSVLF